MQDMVLRPATPSGGVPKGAEACFVLAQPAHHQAPPSARDAATSLGVPQALGFLSVPQCHCQIKRLTRTLLLSYGNKLLH